MSPASALHALSPLDGRYAARVDALRPLLSEFGLLHRRVQVEVAWFGALLEADFVGAAALPAATHDWLDALVAGFSTADAEAIKAIERRTNHDVKAVELWLKARFATRPELDAHKELLHFACTSEDINNTSHALMLAAARDTVLLPALDRVAAQLAQLAGAHAAQPMLARTHGQAATPTTVGKEAANVAARLARARARIAAVALPAKMNGAVGNYNAHLAAWPAVDWEAFARGVVEQRLGLVFNPYTIQIEPHDGIAELCDAVAAAGTVLTDWARDVWGYVSLGYFRQRVKAGEVGSSTMPHKVNPIDFENAEGNFGVAGALFSHLSRTLPVSRWQRDLTDSTVLRNLGVAFGHALLALDSLARGMDKLQVDADALAADLDGAWEVLGEAVQTVMRRHGLPEPYEQLKAFTRGRPMTRELMRGFIAALALPDGERERLLALTPAAYTGLAPRLAARWAEDAAAGAATRAACAAAPGATAAAAPAHAAADAATGRAATGVPAAPRPAR